MANIENLNKKLLAIINSDEPYAVSLTGEWGIGKTHFWKKFYEENHNQFSVKQYAYVSLFGIKDLDEFKFSVALNIHQSKQVSDIMKPVKLLFKKILEHTNFSSIGGDKLSFQISQNLIGNVLSSVIKDTIICVDDVERKSDGLSMSEIMGYLNHLKVEKNCKIIFIFHDGEMSDEDEKIFKSYQEKLFDDNLILDDNFDVIKSIDLLRKSDFSRFLNLEKCLKTKGSSLTIF